MSKAVSQLSYSITHSKFEATDSVSDEAVLIRVLSLFELVVSSKVGQLYLDDKSVCEIVEAAFGMSFQGRASG